MCNGHQLFGDFMSGLQQCFVVRVPEKSLHRLQIMQNQAARILAKVDCHEHITPVLVSLRWLPIRARINYKILMLVYKCIHQDFSPKYLKKMISIYWPSRTLRSSENVTLLCVARVNKSFGDRAYAVSGPNLWNSLPIHLRCAETVSSFKK